MSIPEGAQTVTGEGRDLKKALESAASELGIHPRQVDYKFDMSHFRSSTGISVSRDTVRIIGWASERPAPGDDDADVSAAAETEAADTGRKRSREKKSDDDGEKRRSSDRGDRGGDRDRSARSDRGDRSDRSDRGDRGGRGRDRDRNRDRDRDREAKPERLKGAEEGTTEASDFAQKWFHTLLGFMDVKGEVVGSGNDERVHLAVTADKAGRVIGKRGSTLGAIRHLLSLALEQNFGDLTIDVDVDDDRPKGERPSRSSDSSGGRGRRRDRDSGRRSGGRRSGGRRPRSRDKGKYPEEKLRALARKAGEKAAESGQTITINLELNSYDRRLVHLEISEMEGVESQSEEREGEDGEIIKYVHVIPLAD